MRKAALGLALAGLAFWPTADARAEADTLRAAKQFGLGYIQLVIMEDQKLVEKHLAELGMPDVTVEWSTFRSSDVMNDALISGNVDFVSLGPTGIVTIWDRTYGSYDVKVAAGLNGMAWLLNVRDPSINTIADFKPDQRIAVPAVKVSGQAAALQMAAAKEWGDDQFERLDPLTVSISHPDATAMMLGGPSEIVANFASPPFAQMQLKDPKIRTILTSDDIVGGPFPFNVIATTASFREDNPTLYKAYLDALNEATTMVNEDRDRALGIYLEATSDTNSKEDLIAIMEESTSHFTTDVLDLGAFTEFMGRTGRIDNVPDDWKAEMLFPEAKPAS
ncbi:ABC transporter substrate-binding protein [Marinivivus vitaminiproducens]|uniref:ABC transporter substrate-binding protein n=1 Tax=Marinivivus vitaminiproducens TaxID=3035935 RepID=UPI00279FD661|nr:ABC transporter substrate-binding protein [Geminicoccaceae bacterium SCSIO 64248]